MFVYSRRWSLYVWISVAGATNEMCVHLKENTASHDIERLLNVHLFRGLADFSIESVDLV